MNAAARDTPRENPDLFGHEEAERTLFQAFRSGRLAHAWLISGPRGIGKATLAFRFARYVLARGGGPGEEGPSEGAPGRLYVAPDDPVFRRVASGGHADLLTVERGVDEKRARARSEIVVDDVRGIGAFLSLTPAEGGWRVVIIDAADEMNRSAANAVLKVLEEPPARALLLLVCHAPGRLVATLRSRCRRLALRPLAAAEVETILARARPEIEPATAAELSRLAEGSAGRAMALAEIGGVELHGDLMGLLRSLPDIDVQTLHTLADRLGRPGAEESFRVATDLLSRFLGRLVVSAARPGAATAGAGEEGALADRLAGAAGLDRWLDVWDKVGRLLARAEAANLDRKQVFLNLFLTLEHAVRP